MSGVVNLESTFSLAFSVIRCENPSSIWVYASSQLILNIVRQLE